MLLMFLTRGISNETSSNMFCYMSFVHYGDVFCTLLKPYP